jgi:hypothetical protein
MPLRPFRLGTAVWYSVLLWVLGFVWGAIVFMVPPLKAVQSIPYFSKYPAISLVLLPLYLILVWLVARRYLDSATDKTMEGLKLGGMIFVVSLVLDVVVYLILFNSADYFTFASIWVTYAVFVFLPWLVGKRSASVKKTGERA